MRSYMLCAALAPSIVAGLFWDGPNPTNPVEATFLDPYGMSPVPTNAPEVDFDHFDLIKRQATSDADRTCGYISSDPGNALTCNTGYVCAVNTRNNAAGCCKSESLSSGCTLSTQCVEFGALSTAATSLLTNSFVTKCTNSLNRFCYTAVFPIGSYTLSYLGCSSLPNKETAYQSYTGVLFTTGTTGFPSTATTRSTTATGTSSTGTSTTGTTTGTTTSGLPTQTSAAPTPVSHTGAIVGGIVGGLGALALIGAGIGLCLFRKNKNKKNAAAASTSAAGAPSAGPGPGPNYQGPPMSEQKPPYVQEQPYNQGGAGGYYAQPPASETAYAKHGSYDPQQQHMSQYGNSQYGSQFGSPPHSPAQGFTSPVAPPYQPAMSPPPPGIAEAPAGVPAQYPQPQQGVPPQHGAFEIGGQGLPVGQAPVGQAPVGQAPVGQRPAGAPVHELA